MSMWNHLLCDSCYEKEEPGRAPVRVLDPDPGRCCRCRKETSSGIYYRQSPSLYPCAGNHEEDE
jgi:hypothetical protein